MIITLTGTSLLNNRLQSAYNQNNAYPEVFLDCLDQADYNNLNSQDRKEYGKLVPLLKSNKEEDLVNYLAISSYTSDLNSLSAETKTTSLILLENNLDPKNEKIVFLASDTTECRACAQALSNFYKHLFLDASVEIVKHLSSNAGFFEAGLKELTNFIVMLATDANKKSEVVINATAGFKPEAGYAALCGLLLGIKVYYGHENFDKIVRLPTLPIGADFKQIHLHASKIILALEAGIDAAYSDLPLSLQDLIIRTENGFKLTEAGSILWQQYLASRSEFNIPGSKWILTEKIKEYSLQEKITNYIKAWDHIWVGMQIPQMIDHTQAHSQNLLNLGDQLFVQLPDDFLTEEEMYLLIASIWLHDIGHSEPVMIKEDGNIEWLAPNQIRKSHPLLSYQRIKYDFKFFGFNNFDEEAELIALLCKYHNTSTNIEDPEVCEDFKFNGKSIRLKLLIGLIRLLDVCDNGIQRVGGEQYRLFREKVTDNEITKYEMLKEISKDESAKQVFNDEIEFRKKQKDHFIAHAAVERTSLKVNKNNNGYTIELVFHPVKDKTEVLKLVKEKVGLEKLDNAESIISKQTNNMIEKITAVEQSNLS